MNLPSKKTAFALPAAFRDIATPETFNEFTDNVRAGFPVISYRGKVWRIRQGGKEENYLDRNGDPMPGIEVVLVRSNPHLSKIFYPGGYEEGSTEAPTCWSSNSITPDADVTSRQAKNCAACPKNVWGSKITENGSKARACADARRVAVVFADELAKKGDEATPMLLRIPGGTLTPLKDYVENLKTAGVFPFAIVTRIGFDPQVAHQKLTFKPVRPVDVNEAEAIVKFRSDSTVEAILAAAHEHVVAGTTGEEDEDVAGQPELTAPAPAATPKRASKPVPVVEEEEEEEEIPPPVAPKAPAKRKVTKPVEEEAEAEEAQPTGKTGNKDFDSLLDSILAPKK